MKRSRLQPSSILSPALAVALAVTAATTLCAQPQITAAQLAGLTPVDLATLALTNGPILGNFWFLHGPDPDQPYPPLPVAPLDLPGETPVYDLGGGCFLIDDSAVDWNAVRQQDEIDSALSDLEVQYGLRAAPAGAGRLRPMDQASYTSDDLWLELTCVTNYTANLIVHPPDAEATSGVYDLYLTTSLSPEGEGLNLTNWLWLLRTDPGQTNVTVPDLWVDAAFFMLARTNDTDGDGMSDAYECLVSHTDPNTTNGPVIVTQPLSQAVYSGDTVTFSVVAEGAQPLSYQWGSNGVALVGETNAALRLAAVQLSQAADYCVQITSPVGLYTLSSNATLTVYDSTGLGCIPIIGPRQDFTFKRGPTYLIYSPVQLYGQTVIQGASVIKFDTWTNSTLQIKGSLTMDTTAYAPGILTCMDDNSVGIPISGSSGSPLTATNHCAYLDLLGAQGWQPTLSNLRLSYADQGVTTPLGPATLDLWHCQFVQCASAVVNAVTNGPASARFHNVLFAACQSAVLVAGNEVAITGEHITADVGSFWTGQTPPVLLRLTNSIIIGSIASGPDLTTNHCALNPTAPVFQASAAGGYYLTNDSPYQSAGTTNISARLLADLRQKTAQPPLAFPNQTILKGELTLLPRAARFAGGTLALGYHYDALDYTVATLTLQDATVTVEPGTAIAVRSDPWPDMPGYFSYIGFDLCNGARLAGSGTPTRPIIFTTVQLVQEQPCPLNYCANLLPDLPLDGDTPPTLDFRFCNFYFGSEDYQVLAGMTSYYGWTPSDNSSLNWTLRDCNVCGGGINLGYPGSYFDEMLPPGSVSWANNVFEWVDINLDPTYYWVNPYLLNVDLPFQASNNLFRGGRLRLVPIPTSVGNWALRDNLFERVVFQQGTSLPLDHDHNAYWPCSQSELDAAPVDINGLGPSSSGQLAGDTGGTNYPASDPILTTAPPYQTGPFGDYYLPTATPLYNAGSRTASDAGLYHYTTRIDQFKEGNELSGHMVNIGLHYIAATNGVPQDSDGDGIPDYVENASGTGTVAHNETDWQNPMTDGITADAYSTAYDTVDLDGDGLDGLSEQVLGGNPLSADNSLDLPMVGLSIPASGLVRIPLNVSSAVDSNTPVMLNVDGYSANTAVYKTNGNWVAEWDTLQFSNGVHRLNLEFQSGESSSGVGAVTLVTVQNDICFPDGIPLAGTTLFLQPQTIHTNGTWGMQIYDDQGILFASLSGPVDAEGYCLDPSTSERGISVSLSDTNSNPLPSTYYMAEVTTTNASDSSTSTATNKVGVEAAWSGSRKWVIASQILSQFGGRDSEVNLNIWGTMGLTAEIVQDTFGYNLLYDVQATSPPETWRLGSAGEWVTLAYRLGWPYNNNTTEARNFFYFGHFDGENLGGTTNLGYSISIRDLRSWLGNAPDPLKGPNQHPFRFVFIDGCNSAKGDLCTAFGIPKTQMTSQQMRDKGLEPRAFVGWKTIKLTNLGGVFNNAHLAFTQRFWELWPATNTNTGRPYTLQEALDQAYKEKAPPFFSKPVIYGCPDLPYQ